MPTYTVTSPDGQQIKVDAPDGASDADLIRLAQTQVKPAAPSYGEKMLASPLGRFAKGLKDPIDAGAQMLPRALSGVASLGGMVPNRVSDWLDKESASVDDGIKASENEYQAARWKDGQKGFDGGRLTGNLINPTTLALARVSPSGATSMVGRAVQGGMAGALGGVAATPVTDTSEVSYGMQKLGQGVAGAVGGAVATPILGKVIDLMAPRMKALAAKVTDPEILGARASIETDTAIQRVLVDMGVEQQNIPKQAMDELRRQVLASFKQGQKFDASAQLRKMDFEAQKVPALRGQITRDPKQYSQDLNLRGVEGVGEPIQNLLSAQNQRITQDLSKFGGPKAQERNQAGSLFSGALSKLDDDMSSTVRRAYQNARASSGKDWDVPTGGLSSDLQNVVENFGVGGERNAIPSAIYNRMEKLGVVGDGMTQRKVFNYEEADKLLKQINDHARGGDNASLDALRASVKKALLEGGGEGDPFAPARKLAAQRFSLMEAVPALDAVVKGKASPDDFVQRFIVGGKVGELQKLAGILPDDAMQEAKKQIARVIYEGAFKGNASGDKMASPAGLQSAMKSIGTDKLKVFFSQSEIDELNRLTRITSYANTEPAWGTVARGGNPGGVLFGGLAKLSGAGNAMTRATPLIGAGLKSLQASSALNTKIPKQANLTPEEIAKLSGLLGYAGVSTGGLLAPGP